MKTWAEYYNDFGGAKGYSRHINAWKGFCHRVARFTPDGGKILELGTGSGMMSIYLNKSGYDCLAIDKDEQIIEAASRLSSDLNANVSFMVCDIFNNSFKDNEFDTSFSQGLLEHFSDENINTILEEQLRISKVAAFSVPLDKFGHKSRGDERLLSKEYWKNLIQPYTGLYFETFADSKQLIAIVEGK